MHRKIVLISIFINTIHVNFLDKWIRPDSWPDSDSPFYHILYPFQLMKSHFLMFPYKKKSLEGKIRAGRAVIFPNVMEKKGLMNPLLVVPAFCFHAHTQGSPISPKTEMIQHVVQLSSLHCFIPLNLSIWCWILSMHANLNPFQCLILSYNDLHYLTDYKSTAQARETSVTKGIWQLPKTYPYCLFDLCSAFLWMTISASH